MLLTLLILIYLITFTMNILLYYAQLYFPDLEYLTSMSTVSQEFIFYIPMVKIIMVLIAFSLVPGFFIIRKNAREQYPYYEKISIHLVVMFSFALPLLALISNFITTDFLFSTFLLIYGVLFTVLAFKYR
jgi:hypothetical protein